MVVHLVTQLLECEEISRIIVTKNKPEELKLPPSNKILIIENNAPKGFGANHNFAFSISDQLYFCPLNPDIRLISNPFPQLVLDLELAESIILSVPLVLNGRNEVEDSFRYFPAPILMLRKIFLNYPGKYDLNCVGSVFHPEFAAGMFMLFKARGYKLLEGFDEKFFLYYEDVDLCVRAWRMGFKVIADTSVVVIHNAQRTSRSNLKYLKWHISSMARYFIRYFGRLPKVETRVIDVA
jgi:GT2 family glycosyltransferase